MADISGSIIILHLSMKKVVCKPVQKGTVKNHIGEIINAITGSSDNRQKEREQQKKLCPFFKLQFYIHTPRLF